MKHLTARFLLLFFLSFCRDSEPVLDRAGVRIVSLAPNVTEILFAIGAGDNLLGVTRYCDIPEEAKKKRKAGGILDPDIEAILSMAPDYVIFGNNALMERFSPILIKGGVKTVAFEFNSLAELHSSVHAIGAITGKIVEASRLTTIIERKFSDLSSRAKNHRAKGLRTAVIVGHSPIVLAGKGSFPSEMISLIGLKNIASELSGETLFLSNYPVWSLEELIRSDPEVIIDTVKEEGSGLLQRYFKGKKVIYQPSSGIIRPGARTADSLLEILAQLL